MSSLDNKKITVADLRRANLSENYWYVTLSSIPEHLSYVKKVLEYYARMEEFMGKGVGLYIYSEGSSTGKSSIAAALLKRALRLKKTAFFSEAGTLKNALTKNETFDDQFLIDQRIRMVDLLVVDDFGKEYKTSSGYAENTFENIFRGREQSVKTSIITSNIHPKDIEGVYSTSLYHVFKRCLIPIQVTGYNWTTEKHKELQNSLKG